jgi:hypothetical protein
MPVLIAIPTRTTTTTKTTPDSLASNRISMRAPEVAGSRPSVLDGSSGGTGYQSVLSVARRYAARDEIACLRLIPPR